jgi:hypothetical protein
MKDWGGGNAINSPTSFSLVESKIEKSNTPKKSWEVFGDTT